jgi:predicted amidohydrolase
MCYLLQSACAGLMFALLPVCINALERDVVISTYQGPCVDGDFDANLAAVRKGIGEALARDSDFVVFPETFLSGYRSREDVLRGARRLDDAEVKAFIAESGKHGMVVLVGMARVTPDGLYNTVLVIHRGELLGTFDKIMLTRGDSQQLRFLPGQRVPVFEAHGARFAVIICHDTSFPHPAMIAKLKGAEILFTPHFNEIGAERMDAHRKWVRNCHIGLATQMKMVLVRSNVVRTGGEGLGYGDSFIMNPRGEVMAGPELFQTGLFTATITPALFRSPYVWASFDEVKPNINAMLAELLTVSGR